MPETKDRRWLLIDGSSLIFRSFYGIPKDVTAPDGTLINAVRGTIEAITRLVRHRRPLCVGIGGDADWRPQTRVDLIPSYKAHRVAEPIPPELVPQMPIVEALLAGIGIPVANIPGLEAEDVIASWCALIQEPIDIYSGDRDLFALVCDPDIRVLYPEKGGLAEVDESAVTKRYDIPGRSYADFAILRGDPSDGLPGLKGIGPVGAASLVRQYGSIEALVESGKLTVSQAEYVNKAAVVVRPRIDPSVPLPTSRDNWPAKSDLLNALAKALGIASPVHQLVDAIRRNVGP